MARDESPIFVVGMPRSGTTLMSAMLASHPNISIAPETHFLSEWIVRCRGLDVRDRRGFDTFWAHFSASPCFTHLGLDAHQTKERLLTHGPGGFRDIFATVLRCYAEKRGRPRWGEKTPTHYLHLSLLLEWFPQGRIVFMIRDPRAVVASRLQVPWRPRSVEDVAHQWHGSMRVLARWAEDERVHPVKYERLITHPEAELRAICCFIHEPYGEEMLEHQEAAHGLIHGEPWEAAVLKPRTQESTGKWRSHLTARQIAVVEHINRRWMDRHGYPLEAGPLSPTGVMALQGARVRRRLGRWIRRRKDPTLPWGIPGTETSCFPETRRAGDGPASGSSENG